MNDVVIRLTAVQAAQLEKYLKPFADSIEGEAVKECRPMTSKENIAHSALCWMAFCIDSDLKHIPVQEIRERFYKEHERYTNELKRQSLEN